MEQINDMLSRMTTAAATLNDCVDDTEINIEPISASDRMNLGILSPGYRDFYKTPAPDPEFGRRGS